ncbi:Patatin-like phospholipase [compost metagenome]
MEERGYHWGRLAGTSAGSIVAALLASGYTSIEIKELISSIDYTQLLGQTWLNRLPLINKALPIIVSSGIYSNHILEQLIASWLEKKVFILLETFLKANCQSLHLTSVIEKWLYFQMIYIIMDYLAIPFR